VFLGSPALLGNGNGGPVTNTGTNGHVALAGPAGRVDRPGVMVGSEASGLFAPSATEIAAVASGAEVLRATSAGAVTLGGGSTSHGFGVTTPANSVNRLVASGAVSAGTPALTAQGSDANINVNIAPKGTGVVRLQARGNTALEASAAAAPVNFVRVNGGAGGVPVQVTAQGSDTNVAIQFQAKGAAPVAALNPMQLPTSTVAGLSAFPAATYPRCLIYVSDGATNRRLAVSDGAAWRWPDGAVVS
jgi:hypothetical protein